MRIRAIRDDRRKHRLLGLSHDRARRALRNSERRDLFEAVVLESARSREREFTFQHPPTDSESRIVRTIVRDYGVAGGMQKLDIGDQLIFRAPGRRHDHYDLAPLSGKIPSDHADLAMRSGVILDRSRIVSLRLGSYRSGHHSCPTQFKLRT